MQDHTQCLYTSIRDPTDLSENKLRINSFYLKSYVDLNLKSIVEKKSKNKLNFNKCAPIYFIPFLKFDMLSNVPILI